MTNKLAKHLTKWKAWYAFLGIGAFLVTSSGPTIAQIVGDGGSISAQNLMGFGIFIAFVLVSLALIRLVSGKWPPPRTSP